MEHLMFFFVRIFFKEMIKNHKKNIIGLFETLETTWQELTINLIELLDQYGLRNTIITYFIKMKASRRQ
jgi:methanogenic corrinoid protein MtbC1